MQCHCYVSRIIPGIIYVYWRLSSFDTIQLLHNAWKVVSLIIVGVLCNAIWHLVAITGSNRSVNYNLIQVSPKHLKHIGIFQIMIGRAFVLVIHRSKLMECCQYSQEYLYHHGLTMIVVWIKIYIYIYFKNDQINTCACVSIYSSSEFVLL